jgi:hypothetical protein
MNAGDRIEDGYAILKRQEQRVNPCLEIARRVDGGLEISEGWEDRETRLWLTKQTVRLLVADLVDHPVAIGYLEEFLDRVRVAVAEGAGSRQ